MGSFESADRAMDAWRKQYGDTFTFWMGDDPVVTLCGFDNINEHLQRNGEVFQNRPDNRTIIAYTRGGFNGVVETWGPQWRTNRRFVLHMMRDFGVGKGVMEERVSF